MPPAAKRKRLRRSSHTGPSPAGHRRPPVLANAIIKCKLTRAYAEAYDGTTLASARLTNRLMGTAKWYRLNKDDLVAILVANHFAQKIQSFFRYHATPDDAPDDGSNVGRHSPGNNRVCPISLVSMAEIPYAHRYRHHNTWFDRQVLAQHMFKTSDFINPVTRVEFCEEEVFNINPGLLRQFRDRAQIRAAVAEHMDMVQSVETEMEEVFQTMVEAAEEIPSRREFTIVFDNLAEDFQECHSDLMNLDRDRSVLVLKSLPAVIRGDPNCPTIMSRKRERLLREFLEMRS